MPAKRIDADVQAKIAEMALGTQYGPAQIYKVISRDEKFVEAYVVPSERTVQRLVKEFRSNQTGGEWNLTMSPSGDISNILNARFQSILLSLQFITASEEQISKDTMKSISPKTAEIVAKFYQAVPDYPSNLGWLLAQYYWSEVEAERSVQAYTDYLALAPWRSQEHWNNYMNVVEAKLVEPIELWPLFVDPVNPSIPLPERLKMVTDAYDVIKSIGDEQKAERESEK